MNNSHESVPQQADDVTWAAIRARYEAGVEPIKSIAQAVGLTPFGLTMKAKSMGWLLRNRMKATGKSETTQTLLKRLKDVLHTRLAGLEKEITDIGQDVEKLSKQSDIRNINTLVRTLEKVLDLERKNRNSRSTRERKRLDDAGRLALAEKLDRLGKEWTGNEDFPDVGPENS